MHHSSCGICHSFLPCQTDMCIGVHVTVVVCSSAWIPRSVVSRCASCIPFTHPRTPCCLMPLLPKCHIYVDGNSPVLPFCPCERKLIVGLYCNLCGIQCWSTGVTAASVALLSSQPQGPWAAYTLTTELSREQSHVREMHGAKKAQSSQTRDHISDII